MSKAYGAITTGSDGVDGGVLFRTQRPKVFIQANGLSPWNGHSVHAYDGSGAPGGDGIIYQYTGVASAPTNISGNTGDVLADPAHLVDTHLNGLGTFSHTYLYNPWATHKITITSVTSLSNQDPFGGASDIYLKVTAAGENVVDARLWKYNDSASGVKRYPYWGQNDAEDGNQYASLYDHRYVAKPPGSTIKIQVFDSDGTSGDEDMGYLQTAPAVGVTTTWTEVNTSNGLARLTVKVEAIQ